MIFASLSSQPWIAVASSRLIIARWWGISMANQNTQSWVSGVQKWDQGAIHNLYLVFAVLKQWRHACRETHNSFPTTHQCLCSHHINPPMSPLDRLLLVYDKVCYFSISIYYQRIKIILILEIIVPMHPDFFWKLSKYNWPFVMLVKGTFLVTAARPWLLWSGLQALNFLDNF